MPHRPITILDAHVANRIPPWTIAGDELFVVIATWRPISPGAAPNLESG